MRWQAAACFYFYLFIFSAAQVKRLRRHQHLPGRSLAPALYLDTVDLQVHTCNHFIYNTTLHSLSATYMSWMLNICMYIYNAHRSGSYPNRNAGPLMRCKTYIIICFRHSATGRKEQTAFLYVYDCFTVSCNVLFHLRGSGQNVVIQQ